MVGNLWPLTEHTGRPVHHRRSHPVPVHVQGVAAAVSSSLRRGALAAAAIAFSIASLAACGAGNNADTLDVKPDNAATSVGDIKAQNVTIITPADRQSTGPAAVSATLFNQGRTAQTLDAVVVDGKPVTLTPVSGTKVTVPGNGRVILGGKGNAAASLPSGRSGLADGNVHKVTFSFSRTGDVSVNAFVVPAEGQYTSWGPSAAPATSPSPAASPAGSPAAGASASASPSASASADN